VNRLRHAPRAPLAVSAIIATPLFFLGLMAMSLALEKPTVEHVVKKGKLVVQFGDPSGTNEIAIWLLALAVAAFMVLVGTGAMLLERGGVIVSGATAIGVAIVLLLPLDGWANGHTHRYPVGVDLLPPSSGSSDVYLRGEWEGSARHTARDLAFVAIVMGVLAIGGYLLLAWRRRKQLEFRAGVPAPLPVPFEGVHGADVTPPAV
jgi:hypothetical protein